MKKIFLGYPFSLGYVRDVVVAAGDGSAEIVVASDILRGMPLLNKIEALMEEADLCLFDLTLHNPNVATEFGIAHARKYKYAILYCTDESLNPQPDRESSVFSDVKGWDSLLYANADDLLQQLRQVLPELLEAPHPRGAVPVPFPKFVSVDSAIMPRLFAKVETRQPAWMAVDSGPVTKLGSYGLRFEVRNRGRGVANKVRIGVTGMKAVQRIEALDTGAPNSVKFSWNLEEQEAFRSKPDEPQILVEYEDDHGAKYEQRGGLNATRTSNSEFLYSGEGLGPPTAIRAFSIPWNI